MNPDTRFGWFQLRSKKEVNGLVSEAVNPSSVIDTFFHYGY